MDEIDNLKRINEILINGLNNIIDPVTYLKSKLEEGEKLNGMMIVYYLGKPEFYKEIAQETLKEIQKYESNIM
jgi:hypothetical protein